MVKQKRKYTTKSGRGDSPNPIDIHVGQRIRLQRRLLNMIQQDFAKSLGVTFQQIQKYERGLNRISASRLFDISRVLGVNMAFFFDDMSQETENLSPSRRAGIAESSQQVKADSDPMNRGETLELVRNYYRIPNDKSRKIIFDLTALMSKEIVGRKPKSEE